ncbi:MAG TPA: 2-aminoethylphosphonate--pyruvate transaminase, partial [Rhizobiales bacterium]|nr:2-aminoethylphosphonate--pyruvate transaminase [Hyphomicrobiales bacterium]
MTSSVLSLKPSFNGPEGQQDMPYLLTPGPLTTSRGVKLAMLADWGSRDIEFRAIIDEIRTRLLQMARANDDYECVLMQGAGTFSIEAALSAFCPSGRKRKTLVVANGAYGARAAKILERLRRPHLVLTSDEETTPDPARVREVLASDADIEAVFVVHCETTTGIINPYREIASAARDNGAICILDAMSSFGAIEIGMPADNVDVLVSSANKCIEGVPGFGYVLCRRDLLEASKGKSHSLSLDLYDQWQAMEKNGQFRFTPPTHLLAAFHQALIEHENQGGVAARGARYERN